LAMGGRGRDVGGTVISNDPTAVRLHAAQALALLAVAGATAWLALAPRRTRDRIARLVLDAIGQPGVTATTVVRTALDDPKASIVYGNAPPPGMAATPLLRDGPTVAWLVSDRAV